MQNQQSRQIHDARTNAPGMGPAGWRAQRASAGPTQSRPATFTRASGSTGERNRRR
jgi:hypothetical protein